MILSIYKKHTLQLSISMANEGVSEQICNASITIFTNGILALCRENKELDCLDKQEVKSFTEMLALL